MKTQDKNFNPKNERLENPDQLPELQSWNLSFVMQEIDIDGTNHLIITSGGHIIWNEPAYWEYYDSFIRIGKVLHEKYGKYMMRRYLTKARVKMRSIIFIIGIILYGIQNIVLNIGIGLRPVLLMRYILKTILTLNARSVTSIIS